jgi:hypothetical protein
LHDQENLLKALAGILILVVAMAALASVRGRDEHWHKLAGQRIGFAGCLILLLTASGHPLADVVWWSLPRAILPNTGRLMS